MAADLKGDALLIDEQEGRALAAQAGLAAVPPCFLSSVLADYSGLRTMFETELNRV